MSLLPPTSTFAEQVEVLFTVVRGRGLALGALDRQLLGLWSSQGVPLQIIARGLLRAAERARWNGATGATPRSRRGNCAPSALAVQGGTMVSETGGLPVGGMCVAIDRADRLHTMRFEMVQEPAPRSRKLRGKSPRTWGRRD